MLVAYLLHQFINFECCASFTTIFSVRKLSKVRQRDQRKPLMQMNMECSISLNFMSSFPVYNYIKIKDILTVQKIYFS